MKKILVFSIIALAACNDSKTNEPKTSDSTATKQTETTTTTTTPPPTTATTTSTGAAKIMYTVEGKEIEAGGSALVSKDKEKLKPGVDWFCMLNASGANDEKLTLNFIFDLKPGTYPIVGTSLIRKVDGNDQMFGGLLGGKAKITSHNVNLTECTDLGSNNAGGHKWRLAGTFDEITIPAMGIMLMDKTKNHPKEVKIEKGSFSNVTFDDNTDEILKKAFEKMKK